MQPGEGSVFVCEGSDAWEPAQAITAFLEARGIAVWLGWRDKGEISRPTDYFDARADAACRCGALLLLLSEDPADRRDLRDLAGLAYARGKAIFPVLLSERAPLSEFAEVMGERPWTHAFGPGAEGRLELLAGELQALLGGAELPPEREASAPADAPPPPARPGLVAADPPEAAAAMPAEPAAAAEAGVEAQEHERLLRAFIGRRADYYLGQWRAMDERQSRLSWNWAAFLLGFLWFGARRLWGLALLLALAVVAVQAAVLFAPDLGGWPNLALLVVAAWAGAGANRFYRRRAERVVASVAAGPAGPHVKRAELRARGGVSLAGALALLVVAAGSVFLVNRQAQSGSPLCLGGYCLGGAPTSAAAADADPAGASADPADAVADPAHAAADPAADAGDETRVTRAWLTGRWGVAGTGCRVWLDFNADGTLLDNLGGTGRWLLDAGSPGAATITLITDRTAAPVPARIERRGDTMIFGSELTRWSREGC